MRRIIHSGSEVAPIQVYLTVHSETEMMILVEHHKGVSFEEYVLLKGLIGAQKVIKKVFDYLKALHNDEGIHGGVIFKRLWYEEKSDQISMGNWPFYTNDKFLQYYTS